MVEKKVIQDEINSALQEAYANILEKHNIDSGDIDPEQYSKIDAAEKSLVEATFDWVKKRADE